MSQQALTVGFNQNAMVNGIFQNGVVETAIPLWPMQNVVMPINEGTIFVGLNNIGVPGGTILSPYGGKPMNAFDMNRTGGNLTLGLDENFSFVQM
jgi:hypothetical protein